MIVHLSKWLFFACNVCAESAAGKARINGIQRDAAFANRLDALISALRSLNHQEAQSVSPQVVREALSRTLAN
jgi:hypothetical protein